MRLRWSRSVPVVGASLMTALTVALPGATWAAGAAAPAKGAATTVTRLTATPGLLHVGGGSVTLAATVGQATSCTFSSNRPVTGLPATVACSTGVVSDTVAIPADGGGQKVVYQLTLAVTGTKKVHSKAKVDVIPTSCSDFGRGIDLRDCNLAGDDLAGADLARADLAGADLAGADLADADLAGGHLSTSDLFDADLTGTDVSGVTWSATTCPDGTNSDDDGDTCAGHEVQPPPLPELATASAGARVVATQNRESFTGVTLAQLQADEPGLQFTTGPSTGADQISTYFSDDGNGILLAATQGDGTCWYVGLNLADVIDLFGGPYDPPFDAPVATGTWYGKSSEPTCSAPDPSGLIDWQGGSFPG